MTHNSGISHNDSMYSTNKLRNLSVLVSNGLNVFARRSLSVMTESRLSGSRQCKKEKFRRTLCRKKAPSAAHSVIQVCQC